MLCLITYKVRSENGYGLLMPGLKTGRGNGIFWSEIVSGFGDAGGTPPPKLPRCTPPRPKTKKHIPLTAPFAVVSLVMFTESELVII